MEGILRKEILALCVFAKLWLISANSPFKTALTHVHSCHNTYKLVKKLEERLKKELLISKEDLTELR